MDAEARKQLLLTRIALERVQWSHDLGVLRTVATPGHLLSGAVRSALPPGLAQALFGSSGASSPGSVASSLANRLLQAVVIARRYPILLSLAGGLLARRTIKRVLVVGTFSAAVGAGLWIAKSGRNRG